MSNLTLPVLFSLQDDLELIERLKRHETQAMADAYDRFGKLAFSVILGIVKNEEVAEDLLNEAFIKVWNRVDGFNRSGGSLGAWILAIARNRAIDYVRSARAKSSQNRRNLDTLEEPRFFADLEPDYHNIERIRTICETLTTKLSADQRQTLELAYFEGLSLGEMAAKLQQPPGAVKTGARTALQLLRKIGRPEHTPKSEA
ncbi:MAG TPA: sigma-70 family RNA polymerase sigma factor [Bryobacteraceae bacterium]|jgi:RNA polymerase sigma-70 factor (ECF subfamily)|nr:sigma-70 family RNA polymerase sigma factor [Bryobacteraceae bacterium]